MARVSVGGGLLKKVNLICMGLGIVLLLLGVTSYIKLAITGEGHPLYSFLFCMSCLFFFNLPAVIHRFKDRGSSGRQSSPPEDGAWGPRFLNAGKPHRKAGCSPGCWVNLPTWGGMGLVYEKTVSHKQLFTRGKQSISKIWHKRQVLMTLKICFQISSSF